MKNADGSGKQYQETCKIMDICQNFAEILIPPPQRSISQWADDCRILPPGSPEPGPWRTSRIPFFRAVMDAFDDPRYKTVACSCGSQMGKSESMLNVFGKRFDDGPRVPALMIQPNEKLTRSFSNDRVAKLVESCINLAKRIDRGQSNKVTEKFIAGIRWGFGWAGSATELASHPAGLVILDEVDRMLADVGKEGDPLILAAARLKNYSAGVLGAFSTPTVWPGSKITMMWYGGTMGRWSWPCPHCGLYFIPDLSCLKWDSKATIQHITENAFVECSLCKGHIKTRHKKKMNAKGRYEYHTRKDPDDDEYELIPVGPDPPDNPTASFWISGLASPWQTFGEVAAVMAAAYRSKDQETIKASLNTFCGECYKVKGVMQHWQDLYSLIGQYEPGTVPELAQLITLGADVQALGIYYTIRAWGFNQESWKIESGFIPGETKYQAVWDLFSPIIDKDFDGMRIKRAFVDSGWETNAVYLFSRRFPGIVYATKGQQTQIRPLIMSKVDLSISGRIKKGGVKLYHLDTGHMKSWLFARYTWPIHETGGFHLDSETTDDYLKQITAEQMLTSDRGVKTWEQIRTDNHYLDCEVNALGAAMSLQVHALPQIDERTKADAPTKTPLKKSFIGANKGFLRR